MFERFISAVQGFALAYLIFAEPAPGSLGAQYSKLWFALPVLVIAILSVAVPITKTK